MKPRPTAGDADPSEAVASLDYTVRVLLPAYLAARGCTAAADRLRSLSCVDVLIRADPCALRVLRREIVQPISQAYLATHALRELRFLERILTDYPIGT